MAQPIMNALDAIAGSQASAYVTMADGNRSRPLRLILLTTASSGCSAGTMKIFRIQGKALPPCLSLSAGREAIF